MVTANLENTLIGESAVRIVKRGVAKTGLKQLQARLVLDLMDLDHDMAMEYMALWSDDLKNMQKNKGDFLGLEDYLSNRRANAGLK